MHTLVKIGKFDLVFVMDVILLADNVDRGVMSLVYITLVQEIISVIRDM